MSNEKITDDNYKLEYWEEFKKSQDATEKKLISYIPEMIKTRNLIWIKNSFNTILSQYSGLLSFLDEKGEIMSKWQQREVKYAIESFKRVLYALIDAAKKLGYEGSLGIVINKGDPFKGVVEP